jgi:hypothetical protein
VHSVRAFLERQHHHHYANYRELVSDTTLVPRLP